MITFSIFSTLLKKTLEEIVNGHHNNENCKIYEEKHERTHGKAPQFCRFKDHLDLIPKLLDKIVIEANDDVQDSQSPLDSEENDCVSKPQNKVMVVQDEPEISASVEKPKRGLRTKLKNFFLRK